MLDRDRHVAERDEADIFATVCTASAAVAKHGSTQVQAWRLLSSPLRFGVIEAAFKDVHLAL